MLSIYLPSLPPPKKRIHFILFTSIFIRSLFTRCLWQFTVTHISHSMISLIHICSTIYHSFPSDEINIFYFQVSVLFEASIFFFLNNRKNIFFFCERHGICLNEANAELHLRTNELTNQPFKSFYASINIYAIWRSFFSVLYMLLNCLEYRFISNDEITFFFQLNSMRSSIPIIHRNLIF